MLLLGVTDGFDECLTVTSDICQRPSDGTFQPIYSYLKYFYSGVDSVHVLTNDSAVTGAQLCQYSSCLPWQCLFSCSYGWRYASKQSMCQLFVVDVAKHLRQIDVEAIDEVSHH